MAESNKEILSSIKDTTEKLEKNSSRRFGPKTPSGDKQSKEEEQNAQNIDYLLASIVGSMSLLLFGDKGKNKGKSIPGDISKLIQGPGAGKNIYDMIESIKDSVTNTNGEKADILSKTKTSDFFNQLETTIKLSLKDSSDILMNILNSLSASSQSSNQGSSKSDTKISVVLSADNSSNLDSLIDFLTSLDSQDVIDSQAFKNLKALSELVKDNSELQEIIKGLSSMSLSLEAIASISSDMTSITSKISNDFGDISESLDSSNLTAIKTYTAKDSELFAIINNLQMLAVKFNEFNKSDNLSVIVNTIVSIKVMFDKLKEIQVPDDASLKGLLNIIQNSLFSLITEMGVLGEMILANEKNYLGFKRIIPTVTNLINMIQRFSVDEKGKNIDIVVAERNLSRMAAILGDKGQFAKILEQLKVLGDKAGTKDLTNALSNIQNVFNLVLSDKFIGIFRIVKFNLNMFLIRKFVISGLAKTIDEMQKSLKEDEKKQKNIQLSLKSIQEMFKVIDMVSKFGLLTSLMFEYRADILADSIEIGFGRLFDSLNTVFENANEIKDFNKKISPLKVVIDFLNSFTKDIDTDKISDNVEDMKDIIQNELVELLASIAKLKIGATKAIFNNIDTALEGLKSVFNVIPSIKASLIASVKIGLTSMSVDLLNDLVVEINSLPVPNKDSKYWAKVKLQLTKLNEIDGAANAANLIGIFAYITKVKKLSKELIAIDKLGDKMAKNPEKSGLVKVANAIKTAVDKFNEIELNEKSLKSLDKLVNEFLKVVVVSGAILIGAGMIMSLVKVVKVALFAVTLSLFVKSLTKTFLEFSKNSKDSMVGVKSFALLIVATGGVLIAAGILGTSIDWISVLLFAVTTIGFMYGFCFGVAKITGKIIDKAMGSIKEFALLMVVAGAMVIAGGLLFRSIDWSSAIRFAISTVGFMFLFSMALILPKTLHLFDQALVGVTEFSILMITASALVIAGGLFFKKIDWKSSFLFIASTATFMFTLMLVLGAPKMLEGISGNGKLKRILGKIGKIGNPFAEAMEGAADFAILLVAAGGIMIAGGLLMKYINPLQLILFTVTLAGFIVGVMSPFILAKGPMRISMRGAKEFGILVGISAASILVGGILFTLFPSLKQGTAEFALVLGLFVGGLVFIYKRASKDLTKNTLGTAIALSVLTGVSTFILIKAGLAISKNGGFKFVANVALFEAALFGYVFAICKLVLPLLKKIDKKTLLKGALVMTGVSLITMIAAKAMVDVGNLSKQITWGQLLNGIGQIAVGITLLGGVMTALGALMMIPFLPGILAAGAVVMTGISVVTLIAVKALKSVNDNAEAFGNTKNIESFKNGMINLVKAMGDIIKNFPLEVMVLLPLISASIGSLGYAISSIANGVKDYAELKIPVYEGTKKIGYRPLTDKDFSAAARNVSKVIMVLGQAIIDTYDKKPEMFRDPLIGKTKFASVVNSTSKLGPLISSIAHGVKTYADLKIPLYKGTKITGYRHLDDKDFTAAAKNVSTIILTLGQAIIDTYDKNPEMFRDPLIGKTKFASVVNSTSKLGNMISSIAKGVKDYANMTVTTYRVDPKTGKVLPEKIEKMDGSMYQKASENIQTVLQLLGNAVIAAYDANPDMYNSGLLTDSKFTKVINANLNLGTMISKISEAVKNIANMTITTYEVKNGKVVPQDIRQMDNGDFVQAGKNIKKIMTSLGLPILGIANDEKLFEMFEDGDDSKFAQVIKGNLKLADLISKISKAVVGFGTMKVPTGFDKKGNATGYEKLSLKHFTDAAINIWLILNTLGKTIEKTAANKELVKLYKDSGGILGFGKSKSPFMLVIEGNLKLADLISRIGKAVGSFASSTLIPTKWDPKTGKPIEYVPIDFGKTKQNITGILETLSNSVIGIIDANKDYFKSTNDDNPLFNALNILQKLGVTISKVAKPIIAIGSAKMPVEFNNLGIATKYEKIPDLSTTAGSVKKMLETLIGAVHKIITDKRYASYFTDEKGKEKLYSVLSTFMILGMTISKIASPIMSLARSQIPVAWNKNGIPIKYEKLGKEDFKKAGTAISNILTTMVNAMDTVYTSHKSMFDMDKNDQTTPIFKVARVTGDMALTVSNLAEAVQAYANLSIPTKWNEEGTPIAFRNLKSDEITAAGTAIGEVMKSIGIAFTTVGSDPLFTQSKDVIQNVGEMYKQINSVLGGLADNIQKFSGLSFPIGFDANGKAIGYFRLSDTMIKNAGSAIGDVLSSIGNAVVQTVKENDKLFGDDSIKAKLFGGDPTATPAYAAVMAIQEITKPISTLASVISYFAMGQFPYIVTENGQQVTKLTGGQASGQDLDNAKENIRKLLEAIVYPLSQILDNEKYKDLLDDSDTIYLAKNINGIADQIVKVDQQVQKIAVLKIEDTSDKLSKLHDNLLNNLQQVMRLVQIFHMSTEQIANAGTEQKDNGGNFLSSTINHIVNWFSGDEFDKVNSDMSNFVQSLSQIEDSIDRLNGIVEISKENGDGGYTVLFTGLDGLKTRIASLPPTENFKSNVNQLERYVNVVNRIDLTRIIQLNRLATSLNILARKMGNLDRLTDALAIQIANVLANLTNELKHAENTIEDAKKLQKARHELIKKSTEKIKEIMNQKMIVEISQVSDQNPLGTEPSGTTPSPTGDTNPAPSREGISDTSDTTTSPTQSESGTATIRSAGRNPGNGGTQRETSYQGGLTTQQINAIANAVKQGIENGLSEKKVKKRVGGYK